MLEDWEYKIIQKYENGRIQDEEDEDFLERMHLIGLTTLGFSTSEDTAVDTAGLTQSGKRLLHWERLGEDK